jgi:hypothetical protein
MWKLIFALAYIEDTIPMSDIDGIKAEIRTEISDYEGCADFNEGIRFGLRTALEIIDKNIQPKKIVGKLISVDVLDKIRAEVEKVFCMSVVTNELRTPMEVKTEILQLIDKYR